MTPPRRREKRTQVADRTDELTPKDVLRRNLDAASLKTGGSEYKYVCLYTCGSLCPVHMQHVRMQEMAKVYLETKFPELRVVGGYLATSNDLYVSHKYRSSNRLDSFLPWATRAELVDLALEGHEFIRFDKWDGEEQPSFQEYFMAQAYLQLHLNHWCEINNLPKIRVLAVHGGDHVQKCRIHEWFPMKGLGCVCVERPPIEQPSEKPDNFFFTMPLPDEFVERHGHQANVSSTRVQELSQGAARKKGEISVEQMLRPQVLQRLCQLWNVKPGVARLLIEHDKKFPPSNTLNKKKSKKSTKKTSTSFTVPTGDGGVVVISSSKNDNNDGNGRKEKPRKKSKYQLYCESVPCQCGKKGGWCGAIACKHPGDPWGGVSSAI